MDHLIGRCICFQCPWESDQFTPVDNEASEETAKKRRGRPVEKKDLPPSLHGAAEQFAQQPTMPPATQHTPKRGRPRKNRPEDVHEQKYISF